LGSLQEWGWWAPSPRMIHFLEFSPSLSPRVQLKSLSLSDGRITEISGLPNPVVSESPRLLRPKTGSECYIFRSDRPMQTLCCSITLDDYDGNAVYRPRGPSEELLRRHVAIEPAVPLARYTCTIPPARRRDRISHSRASCSGGEDSGPKFIQSPERHITPRRMGCKNASSLKV
jgi:hypothetical protein